MDGTRSPPRALVGRVVPVVYVLALVAAAALGRQSRVVQVVIDACRGPIEIDWRSDPQRWGVHPPEIAEHKYCGGWAFTSLRRGALVRIWGRQPERRNTLLMVCGAICARIRPRPPLTVSVGWSCKRVLGAVVLVGLNRIG